MQYKDKDYPVWVVILGTVLGIIAVPVVVVSMYVPEAFTLMMIWKWYLAEFTGRTMSFGVALGFSMFFGLISSHSMAKNKEESKQISFGYLYLWHWRVMLAALGIAWLFHFVV